MLDYIKIYLVTVPIFFAIDMTWLGLIATQIYKKYIGNLMRPVPNWPAAIIFYLIFIVGLIIFSIYPALKNHSWTHALIYGALFGFFTYMTFDLTSLSVLKDWPLGITIIDIVWGTFLSCSVATASYFICRSFINL
jgi:uncharacterized membrane protein